MDSKRLFSSLEKLNFVRVSRTEEERKAAQIILKEIEDARVASLNSIKEKIDPNSKEYDDSIKGAEIVAKRARIKEKSNL